MSKFNNLLVEYTNTHGLPEGREALLDRIVDAEEYAEDGIKVAANTLIREAREERSGDLASKVKFIRGMIAMAEGLGIKVNETPYEFDKDGRPELGITYSWQVSAGGEYAEEGASVVGVDITLIGATGEAYYCEWLDQPGSLETLDTGFVPLEEAPEMAWYILYHGMDLISENAVWSELDYTEEEVEANYQTAEKAKQVLLKAIAGEEE